MLSPVSKDTGGNEGLRGIEGNRAYIHALEPNESIMPYVHRLHRAGGLHVTYVQSGCWNVTCIHLGWRNVYKANTIELSNVHKA